MRQSHTRVNPELAALGGRGSALGQREAGAPGGHPGHVQFPESSGQEAHRVSVHLDRPKPSFPVAPGRRATTVSGLSIQVNCSAEGMGPLHTQSHQCPAVHLSGQPDPSPSHSPQPLPN